MVQLAHAPSSHGSFAVVAGAVFLLSSFSAAFAQSQSSETSTFRDLSAARTQLERVSHGPRTQPRQGLLAVAQDSFDCWSAQTGTAQPAAAQQEAAACREDFWSAVNALDILSKDRSDVAHAR